MSRWCRICRGTKRIELAVHEEFVPDPYSKESRVSPFEYGTAEFPCPECSGYVTSERLAINQFYDQIQINKGVPKSELRKILARRAADQFVHYMLEHDLIKFEEYSNIDHDCGDIPYGQYLVRSTIVVVAPKRIAAMQERLHAEWKKAIDYFVPKAKYWIKNWGSASSYYDHRILKEDVYREIDTAARFAKEEEHRWKTISEQMNPEKENG